MVNGCSRTDNPFSERLFFFFFSELMGIMRNAQQQSKGQEVSDFEFWRGLNEFAQSQKLAVGSTVKYTGGSR